MTKRHVGIGLICLGLALALAVIPLWIAATNDAESAQTTEDYRAAIVGVPAETKDPNRTLPLAVGAIAAVVFLAGVIVVSSGPSPDS